jgi:uncharacterized protein
MRLLLISDPHNFKSDFKSIREKAMFADLILLAGDFTVFGTNQRKILSDMNSLNKFVLIIPGNHEDPELVRKDCNSFENLIYLDEMIYEIGEYLFLGLEGSGFAKSDPYFEKVVKEFIPMINEKRNALKKVGQKLKFILMTHAPPYKTKLDLLHGHSYCGNDSIRKFIVKMQPDIAISGHIHETFGAMDYIKKTLVINPGPKGVLYDI